MRIVRDILLGGSDWSPAAFAPYVEERRERMHRPETIELIRLYYAISDQRIRHQFLDMVKTVAQAYKRQD